MQGPFSLGRLLEALFRRWKILVFGTLAVAVLAAVIRDQARRDLRGVLRETAERLEFEHGPALASFEGDTAPFEMARPELEACLLERRLEQPTQASSKNSKKKWIWMAAGGPKSAALAAETANNPPVSAFQAS